MQGGIETRRATQLTFCLVSGILCDPIFDRRACFTSLALHAYGDTTFTPRFAALRAGGPVAMTLIALDFVRHYLFDHSPQKNSQFCKIEC